MIQLKNIYKHYTQDKVITKLNLEIKKGEFIALTGPSGSGKSTLLNLIGGLIKPTKGKITIDEKELNKYSDKELAKYRNKTIGFIFQEFYLDSFLSVKENILLPTHFNKHKKKTIEENLKKIIAEVELTHKTNTQINTLSGGQKQRVAIARALINKPEIILADEPTGNLDAKTGQKIIQILKKLHKNHNITLIIATHDPAIANSADRIITFPI